VLLRQNTLSSPEERARSLTRPVSATELPSRLQTLLDTLVFESNRSEEGTTPPVLEYLLKHDVLANLVRLCLPDLPRGIKGEVIRLFSNLLVLLDERFIVHNAVHKPLVKLLRSCVEPEDGDSGGWRTADPEYEEDLVDLMCHVCSRIKGSPELVVIFLNDRGSRPSHEPMGAVKVPSSPTPSTSTFASSQANPKPDYEFLIFSYLLRFVHREGRTGDFARAGLLFLVDVAMSVGQAATRNTKLGRSTATTTSASLSASTSSTTPPVDTTLAFAEYLLDSDFAEVLGAGLGALYGLLPSKLVVRPPGASGDAGDPEAGIEPSGMVLGGLGDLAEDETAKEPRDRNEEARMRALGLGISDSPEFKAALHLFLKLVEFTQDVVRRSPSSSSSSIKASVGAATRPLSPDSVPSSLTPLDLTTRPDSPSASSTVYPATANAFVAPAIGSSILSSVRAIFLENVVYPSILECSEADGSAVAVLSYLDALLGVVDPEGPLADTISQFLMAEEDDRSGTGGTLSERFRFQSSSSPTPDPKVKAKLRRRKSSALVLIESTGAKSRHDSSYFTSSGRFSLRDLILQHVNSHNQPTATAALKLVVTLSTRHGRTSLSMLDIVPDPKATAFPVAFAEQFDKKSSSDADDESDVFVYPANGQDDSDNDSDNFAYPGAEPVQPPKPPPPRTPARLPARTLARTPAQTLCEHVSELESLLSIADEVSASRSSRTSEMLSTGYGRYLEDAESAIARDPAFRRGLDQGVEDMIHHRLISSSPLVSSMIDSLSHFFEHSPELNLALTGAFASLTVCAYRSLEGWLVRPRRTPRSRLQLEEDGPSGEADDGRDESDDGDDRSFDFSIDAQRIGGDISLDDDEVTAEDGAVFGVMRELARQVDHYRATIPGFDRYLGERRQGLTFAENLADALNVDDDSFLSPPSPSLSQSVTSPALAPPWEGDSLISRLSVSAGPSPLRSPLSEPPTPATPTRSTSTHLNVPGGGGGGSATSRTAGPVSPFAAHYRQTGSISVTPLVARASRLSSSSPDTPLRRCSGVVTLDTLPEDESDGSDSRGGGGGDVLGARSTEEEPATVSLSTILDNVVVLEEAVKELVALVQVRKSLGIDPII
jgi:hypothetical protein